MLIAADIFFTILHLALTGFNLLGWIWRATRKIHLVTILLTAASWFILGIWYGIGYCPITDWQWQVKRKLGETDLPSSFIKYFGDRISGRDIDPQLVNYLTVGLFFFALGMSVFLNLKMKREA